MSLRNIPESFNIDSEEDLRFIIAKYFIELGFDANELSFEDTFSIQLGHNTIIVGNSDSKQNTSRGFSDILVTRNGNPIIVIETKNVNHKLTEEDAQQVISYARRMGIKSPLQPYPSLAIGGAGSVTVWEMATAYTVFPNGGIRKEPFIITEIRDRHGNIIEHREKA